MDIMDICDKACLVPLLLLGSPSVFQTLLVLLIKLPVPRPSSPFLKICELGSQGQASPRAEAKETVSCPILHTRRGEALLGEKKTNTWKEVRRRRESWHGIHTLGSRALGPAVSGS